MDPLNLDALGVTYARLPSDAPPARRVAALLALLRSNPAQAPIASVLARELSKVGLLKRRAARDLPPRIPGGRLSLRMEGLASRATARSRLSSIHSKPILSARAPFPRLLAHSSPSGSAGARSTCTICSSTRCSATTCARPRRG